LTPVRVLQEEPGRTIVIEDGAAVVRKTFYGDDPTALGALVRREAERMREFADALDSVEGAECPRPIEVSFGPEPFIRMTRARGERMQDLLATQQWTASRFEAVAAVLDRALTCYVQTFGEPYWDFILRNMFYDVDSGVVTFLDFGIPTIYEPRLEELNRFSPVEVSIGGLVASSIFEAGRPIRMSRRLEHRQAPRLSAAVARMAIARGADPGGIRAVAKLTYGLASSHGGPTRRAWYATAGRCLARPGRKLNALRAEPGDR
jgi:hypothetical protein